MSSGRLSVLAVAAALVFSSFVAGTSQLATHARSAPGVTSAPATAKAEAAKADAAMKEKAAEAFGKLPLHFEANVGQTLPGVDFVAHGRGYETLLSRQGALLRLHKSNNNSKKTSKRPPQDEGRTHAVAMSLPGANPEPRVAGLQPLPGKVNYYVGDRPENWLDGIGTFAKVRYGEVYPGIDLVYYGNQGQLEYDFVVAPGADPAAIRLAFAGADGVEVDAQGGLVLQVAGDQLRQPKPFIYQNVNGVRQGIPGGFVLTEDRQVRFQVGAYDTAQPLVIDPTLAYSSFLGGSGEDPAFSIAVDPAGNIYVSGVSNSLSPASSPAVPFDLMNPWGPEGAICCGGGDTGRAFVTKMNPTGTALIFSTYLGGFAGYNQTHNIVCPIPDGCGGDPRYARGWDVGWAVAADSAGNAYVAGHAESLDFPTTADAVRKSHPGPTFFSVSQTNGYVDHPRDGFLAKFSPTGALTYSSLIGGHGSDSAQAVTVVDTGPGAGIYVAGLAQSVDFFGGSPGVGAYPAVNAYQTTLNKNSTWGGPAPAGGPASCHDAATTSTAPSWACWRDGFLMRLSLDGKTVQFSTLVGGSGDDGAYGIAVDSATGNAHVVGDTESTDFPTTAGVAQQCMGRNGGYPADLALQSAGMPPFVCHLSPAPQTADYPTQAQKPPTDAFVTKFGPGGASPLMATYLGGSSDDSAGATQDDKAGDFGKTVALDNTANIYLTGWTESFDSTKPPANPPGSPPAASNGQSTNCGPIVGNAQFGTQPCPTYFGFPTTVGAFQTNLAQSPTTACGAGAPADCVPPNKRPHANTYATKLNPTGTTLGYSTYIGGFGDDAAFAISVDSAGQAYIAGSSDSTNYPLTAGKTIVHPNCPTCGANINGIPGPYNEDNPPQASDGFITKVNPTGAALLYSTYLGGSNDEVVHGMVHSTRAGVFGVYVAGLTTSSSTAPPPKPPDPPGTNPPTPPWPSPWYGYPTTPDAFQATSSPDRTVECNCGTPLPSIPNEETFITRLNDNADEAPAAPVSGGPTTPDFTLAANPGSVSIPLAGPSAGTGSFTVSINSAAGFNGAVTLNATVMPASGLTVTPTSATVTPTGTTYAATTFNLSSSTAGSYTVSIAGTSGTLSHTITVPVAVVAPDFSITANPNAVSFPQVKGSGTFSVPVTAVGGLSQNVTVTPAATTGLTFTPTSASVPPGSSGSFTVTASTPGTYTVTITGSCTSCGQGGSSLSHTTTLTVTARPANFSLAASPNSVVVSRDGGSATSNVAITPIDNFSGTVTLTPSWNGGTPTGLSIGPSSATKSGPPYMTTTFTVTSTSAVTPGTYTVTITGTGGTPSLTRPTTLSVIVPSNTGFRNPSANTAANSSGDGNGFEVNPTNAYTDNGLFAVDTDSGGSTGTSCTSQNKDSHRFFNYGLPAISAGQQITGVEVRLDAKADSTAGTPKMCVQLSWNNGSSWTTIKSTPTLTTSEATYILGGAGDTWGRTWTPANFGNGSFQVRVIDVSGVSTTDFYLDWVAVKVHYR